MNRRIRSTAYLHCCCTNQSNTITGLGNLFGEGVRLGGVIVARLALFRKNGLRRKVDDVCQTSREVEQSVSRNGGLGTRGVTHRMWFDVASQAFIPSLASHRLSRAANSVIIVLLLLALSHVTQPICIRTMSDANMKEKNDPQLTLCSMRSRLTILYRARPSVTPSCAVFMRVNPNSADCCFHTPTDNSSIQWPVTA